MTSHELAATLLLSCFALTAWVTLVLVIPWLTRKAVLYKLHDLRDELYLLGEEVPGASRTRTYAHAELISTTAIRIVRERPLVEAVGFVDAMIEARSTKHSGSSIDIKHAMAEVRQVFGSEQQRQQLARVLSSQHQIMALVMVRVFFAKPIITVTVFVVLVAKALKALLDRFIAVRVPGDFESLSKLMEASAAITPDSIRASSRNVTLKSVELARRYDPISELFRRRTTA